MSGALLPCMVLVATVYDLPPRLLPAVHAVEGGRVGAVVRNSNGSEDLGPMQVNTVWLPALARYTRLPEVEVRERLVHHACFNVAAAGMILRGHLDATGGDLMRAVGNYHSRTPERHELYRQRVLDAARRLFASRTGAGAGAATPR